MSPLFRDRLLVSLAPDSVVFARISGTLKQRLVSRQIIDCDPAFGVEPWQGAAAALAVALGPLKTQRLDVTVVLSNHFARYVVVPFDSAISGLEEETALARFHFTKVHGERAKGWEIRLSEGSPASSRLAGAVDTGLIEAIRSSFVSRSRMRLVSIQPFLMSAFNQWRGEMRDEDAWLLLVEPQRACLALIAGRACTAVHSTRGEFPTLESWADLLDRQQLRVDGASAARKVLVHLPTGQKPITAESNGWRFHGLLLPQIQGFRPLEDRRVAMALSCR